MAPRNAKLPGKKALLLNGGVLVIVSASVIWALKSSFLSPDVAACSERYPRAVRIGLDRNGQAVDAAVVKQLKDWPTSQLDTAALGKLAPDFELTSLSGEKVRLCDFRG